MTPWPVVIVVLGGEYLDVRVPGRHLLAETLVAHQVHHWVVERAGRIDLRHRRLSLQRRRRDLRVELTDPGEEIIDSRPWGGFRASPWLGGREQDGRANAGR